MNKFYWLKVTGVKCFPFFDSFHFWCASDCAWCFVYFLRTISCKAILGLMTAHCFHNTVRRVKNTAMNDLLWHGVFVERAIGDWIHGEVDDVLIGIKLLFKFKYINGDEVQYLWFSLSNRSFNLELYTCIFGCLYPSESFSFNIP